MCMHVYVSLSHFYFTTEIDTLKINSTLIKNVKKIWFKFLSLTTNNTEILVHKNFRIGDVMIILQKWPFRNTRVSLKAH